MADLPGALLLQTGVLRREQLSAAAALRNTDGGSIGECLVRLGYVDEETLAQLYHRRLMIARIADHQLVNIKKKVLALVPSDMAAEFRVVPLETDNEGGLTLAMADPADNHAVDEVAFFADKFIVRVVATESAIRDAIERHYGVHFSAPRAADRVGVVVGATPASAAPKTEAPLDRPPNPSPPPSRRPEPAPPKPRLDIIEEQIVLLTEIKQAEDTPLPQPAPPPPENHREFQEEEEPILLTKPVAAPPTRKKRDTLPGFAQITAPDPPLLQLRAARARDEIATAVLDYVGQLMSRCIFFVMKKSQLSGYDARGQGINLSKVKQLVINVGAPSLFNDVVNSRLPYRGPLPETPANRAFAQSIGGAPAEVLLMPMAVRDRIIALLYADGMAGPLPEAALHATMREAGLAYERLIIDAKLAGQGRG
jgi:hypothetical protein